MEEKTAVGSALRWLLLWAFPALLLTPVLLMVSGVGATSVGSLVTPRPGEAIVMCLLTEDVNQTKHDLVIRHFSYTGDAVKVFDCAWLKKDPDKPDCRSYHNFTLEALEKDYVAASVPRTQLHKDGSYKCQLVPPDDDESYTRCVVFHSGTNGDQVPDVFLPEELIPLVTVIVIAVMIFRIWGPRRRIRNHLV